MRTDDGRLMARGENGEQPVTELSGGFCAGESGVSAGADRRRNGDDGHAEGGAAGSGGGDRSGQDQPVDEQGRTGAGAAGNFAGRVANAAGSVVHEYG